MSPAPGKGPIEVTVVGTEAVVAKLARMPADLNSRLKTSVTSYLIRLQRYVKESKLSGQVLNRRSGRLSASIHYTVNSQPGLIEGRVHAGKDAPYARLHEFGGAITRRLANGKTYTQNYKTRSFLRTALAESQPDFRTAVNEAMTEALFRGKA